MTMINLPENLLLIEGIVHRKYRSHDPKS